jgi:hypothetical protein
MPQTFLALVAVFILSTYALGQVRNSTAVARNAVQREVELAAADLARTRLANITERYFDEADNGRTSLRFSTIGLTPLSDLGPDPGETAASTFDDVDDFHVADGSSVADSIEWDGGVLHFDVTTSVRYVDPANPEVAAGAPTLAKEIVVTVAERTSGALGRRPVSGRLSAVVSAVAQRPI